MAARDDRRFAGVPLPRAPLPGIASALFTLVTAAGLAGEPAGQAQQGATGAARPAAEAKGPGRIAARHAGEVAAGDYEQPPVLEAAACTPAALVSGPRHHLAREAPNDGYVNHFVIESELGRFAVAGQAMLAIRVRELDAIAALDEVSRTKVFLESAARSAAAPAVSVVRVATDPVETVRGVPAGVSRAFRSVKRGAGEAKDAIGRGGDEAKGPHKDAGQQASALAKRYLGITAAHRKWAQKLGIDPYTSNPVLVKRLDAVAKVDRAGRLAVAFAPLPSIPGAGTASRVNGLVWGKDPYELRVINEGQLREMGVDDATAKRFLDDSWFSPSRQTALVASLLAVDGAADRGRLVAAAAGARSEEEALFYQEAALLLERYHASVARIVGLVPGARGDAPLPLARTATGKLVSLLPVDYLCWTPEVAALVGGARSAEPHEVWLAGRASPRLGAELARVGWSVETDARARLEGAAPPSAEAPAPSPPR